MTNKQIARTLKETATLIELSGGNAYRARAFQNASRRIDQLDEPAVERAAAGTLTDISGIGSGLAAQIDELLERGSFDLRDALLADLPPGLLDLIQVKGLGAKRVRTLWQERGITSLGQLEAAAEAGQLSQLGGFGKKTEANVLANVRQLLKYRKRRRYADAVAEVRPVIETLRAIEGVERVEVTGALRRKLETVDAADILVAGGEPDSLGRALAPYLDDDAEPVPTGDVLTMEGHLPDGLPLRVRVVPSPQFGTHWWWSTGSSEHCTAFEDAYGAPADHADENAIYAQAGLPYVPAELREGRGELEGAAEGTLPDRLIRAEDLRGTLHNHSTYSDGADTLRAMVEAARSMGLSYFGVCDHSRTLTIASGLSIEEVRRQQDEIRVLNEEFATDGDAPFRIFSGIESDILDDGSLDYPDDVLASFDFVVASIHSGFNMTAGEATERIERAVANPYTTILGHATGRLLLRREGYPIHHDRVIEACARQGVAIELNANPYRLDMDWRYLREATQQGVLISINPDAHSTDELHNVGWGVDVARKAWLTPDQCLNALSLDGFEAWLDRRRARADRLASARRTTD